MGTTQVRILIAEDSLVNQKILLRILKQFGLYADVVSTGHEAVMAVDTVRYDIIFMDVHMPEMDGLEATRWILNSNGQMNVQRSSPLQQRRCPVTKKNALKPGWMIILPNLSDWRNSSLSSTLGSPSGATDYRE